MNIFGNSGPVPRKPVCGLYRTTSRLALLAGWAGLAALSSPAQAQCVEGPPNTFTCAGQTDDPQILAGFDPIVVTTPGFGVDTTLNGNGPALTVNGFGLVSYTDLQASALIGFGTAFVSLGDNGPNEGGLSIFSDGAIITNGINALRLENFGTGTINAVWSGPIFNPGGNGVFVDSNVGSGDVALNFGDVIARDNGIQVVNNGAGATGIVASGSVTSNAGSAIRVENGAATTGLLIDVGAIQADIEGILAVHNGTGDTVVNVAGLTESQGNGVIVITGTNSDDLTISTGEVRAAFAGVVAENHGGGDTIVTTNGLVTASGDAGVIAFNDVFGRNVIVNTQGVRALSTAIIAQNEGAGETLVNAAGAVTSVNGNGIAARNTTGTTSNLTVLSTDVNGGEYGILAENQGAGITRIVSTGTVVGLDEAGIDVSVGALSTGLTVDAGAVGGQTRGVSVSNAGTGPTSVSLSGPVAGATEEGVFILNQGTATELTLNTARVTGGSLGIHVINAGTGGVTQVNATGLVTGLTGTGILADSGANAGDLEINATDVRGLQSGISAFQGGAGSLTVRSTGTVSGQNVAGIFATGGAGSTGIAVEAATVTGESQGIRVDNLGVGAASIVAAGPVTGSSLEGVRVTNDLNATDIRIEVANVAGGTDGIEAENLGTGDTGVTATGLAIGADGHGIRAENSASAGRLEINAVDVQGSDDGISAEQNGAADLLVKSTGTVVAADGRGIFAAGGVFSTGVTVEAASVSGGQLGGIGVENLGVGASRVTAAGLVTSSASEGIFVVNGVATTDLRIEAANVVGNTDGVEAANLGSGQTAVTVAGTVTGLNGDGIRAFAGANTDGLAIDANIAAGSLTGISASNEGSGPTTIIVRNTAMGGTEAINLETAAGQMGTITNLGLVQNLSGQSSARAITATGGSVGLANAGTLNGTVDFSTEVSSILNAGRWNSTGGISFFAGDNDGVQNAASGVIVAASGAASADTTVWFGLERFENNGLIAMLDGGITDRIQTSADSVFTNGSLLAVDIGGVNGADIFRTSGTVDLLAGSGLGVNASQPLTLYNKYVVVEAEGGLTGQFSFADQYLTAFAGLRDGYTPTTAFVEFAQLRDLADAGVTPNQKETAAGADSLPDGNDVKDALLLLPDDAAAQDAFDQLSGEIHPSARTAMVEDSRLPRGAVLARLSDGEAGGALWGQAFGNWGTSDGDRNAATLQRDTYGFVVGGDVGLGENVMLGLAAAYLDTDLAVRARDSSGSAKTVHGLAYIGGRFGDFRVKAGIGYAKGKIDTRRTVAFPGFSDNLTADYDGTLIQGFAEIGYRLPLGGGHVEPFANVTTLRAKTDAFVESGGAAALAVARGRETNTVSTLGLRFETASAGAFSVGGMIGWQHGFGSLDPAGVHSFAGDAPFTILGAAQSRNAGVANVEARFRLSPTVSIGVSYDGVLGTASQDHAVKGALRVAF